MTYLIDFARNIIKKSNIGIFIYLIINVLIITGLFSDGFRDISGVLFGIIVYAISLAIALSPIGEWILRLQTGCKKINRKEYIDRLEPLFLESLAKAKSINASIPDDVKLFMCDDKSANAFATGRKTICLTKGFLNYTDKQIKAIFAHELGHLSNKDTDLILMITIGNFIITAIFIIFRVFAYFIGFLSSFISKDFGVLAVTFLIDIVLVAAMWIWTKIGTLLVMYSSRQNEFLADEFAYNCGFGDDLAAVLDSFDGSGAHGLWANLVSTHPNIDNRIAKLQELGSSYIRE